MFRTKTESAEDAVCLLNAGAGSNRAARERRTLETLFREHGKNVRVVLARGSTIANEARAAVERKTPLIIAAGGDGTVSAVACMVQGTGSVMGVLPLGTLNHFAKDLKIPLDLPAAVATLFAGTETRVDVGEVNRQIFINNSSLGLYPGVVQLRDALQKRGYRKWPSFARAMLYAFRHVSPLSLRMAADDGAEQVAATPFLFIGNNAYELSAPHAGERPALNEGKLWAYYAPRAGRWTLIFLALRALLGNRRPAELKVVGANEFWIRSRHSRIRVANDGEVVNLTPPLHYRSIPGALRVMVPAAKDAPGP